MALEKVQSERLYRYSAFLWKRPPERELEDEHYIDKKPYDARVG